MAATSQENFKRLRLQQGLVYSAKCLEQVSRHNNKKEGSTIHSINLGRAGHKLTLVCKEMAAYSERDLAAASLVLRVLTLLLLIASLIIMVTNKIYFGPFSAVEDPPNFTFRDRLAYR